MEQNKSHKQHEKHNNNYKKIAGLVGATAIIAGGFALAEHHSPSHEAGKESEPEVIATEHATISEGDTVVGLTEELVSDMSDLHGIDSDEIEPYVNVAHDAATSFRQLTSSSEAEGDTVNVDLLSNEDNADYDYGVDVLITRSPED